MPGECNKLLPVLVERLRTVLEQSCSSQSADDRSLPVQVPSVDNDEDLRTWASGLCNSLENQRHDDSSSQRGLKLDLKFLEDLLLSDIHTALGRLQETLQRVDIGTLTRYSSTLDPNNKLNLLKLISSLLANLKIPDEAIVKPEKTANLQQSGQPRRRRTDRHTIGVSTEEIARARKWIEEKNLSPNLVDHSPQISPLTLNLERQNRIQEKLVNPAKENGVDKFDNVHEKSMKDAINQQQSLQCKSKDSLREMGGFQEPSGKCPGAPKLPDTSYKDDNAIINEEYGMSAVPSLYHQSNNAQAKCNKFMAKKSKIKRANTIDIPNYLKLQAESLAKSQNGCMSLRRPINIGDKYANFIAENAVPSFEPKTENDRKFLALISKNNEITTAPPTGSLPFKSFNYRQTSADKNWNSRFSNIKTTFDKPQSNCADHGNSNGVAKNSNGVIVGSLRLPYGVKEKIGFSHAPTSPFQKIDKSIKEEGSPGFPKAGYMPNTSSGTLRAKVKMFDQDNANPLTPVTPQPAVRSRAKQLDAKRTSSIFENNDDRLCRVTENGHLNYHSFCKQFAPFVSKNLVENHKTNAWTCGNIVDNPTTGMKTTRNNFVTAKDVAYSEENNKVPVAYKTDRSAKTERKPRNRKLYDTYDGSLATNVVSNTRQVVAYPIEINYQKRSNNGKINRDNSMEKGDYEDDPEQVRDPLVSLRNIKSALPSARNPSPPTRGIFSTQNVAVQTNQSEPPRVSWKGKNSLNPTSPAPPSLPEDAVLPQKHPFAERHGSLRNYTDSFAESYKGDDTVDYGTQGRQNLPQNSPQVNYPSVKVDYKYYPGGDDESYAVNSYGQTPPQVPIRSNPPPSKTMNPLVVKKSQKFTDYEKHDRPNYDLEFEDRSVGRSYTDNDSNNFYRDNQNAIYVPPFENSNNPPARTVPEALRSYEELESGDMSEDHSFVDDENIQNQDISSTDGVVTRYTCAIATVSSASESPVISPLPTALKDLRDIGRHPRVLDEKLTSDQRVEILYPQPQSHIRESNEPSLDEIRRHNLLQQNLIRQLQGEQVKLIDTTRRVSQDVGYRNDKSVLDYPEKIMEDNHSAMVAKESRRLSEEVIYRDDTSVLNYPGKMIEDTPMIPKGLTLPPQETVYRDEKSSYPAKLLDEQPTIPKDLRGLSQEAIYRENKNLNYPLKLGEDHPVHRSTVPREIRRLSQKTPYRDEKSTGNLDYPGKILEDHHSKLPKDGRRLSQEAIFRDPPNYPSKLIDEPSTEPIIESNNTQDKINIFESRNNSVRKLQQQHFKPLSIPRQERETFVPPKINVVSPSKVIKPCFNSDGCRASNSGSSGGISLKSSSPVDSSDEYLMSCASRPSRSIVLSKSESWHQLALSKSTLQVPQQHQPCALLKPPKPKSPSSLRLSKQYEASSSSDNIRKMEDKIQRYFQGPTSSGPTAESAPPSPRRDPNKSKRNFASKRAQGSLMRSQTMPHIYDETSDVEKAFDSLFKEATRTDNRY